MRPSSVGAYGRIQERILRAIDEATAVPKESDFYLRLGPGRIASRGQLLLAQTLIFLPLLVSVLFRLRRTRPSMPALFREAVDTGSILVVMLLGLIVLRVLPKTGLMPDYALYPPPPRHPVLTHVQWAPVLLVLVAVGVTVWIIWVGKRRPLGDVAAPDRAMAVAATLLWLLVISVIALLDNPFGAVTFLLLPAFLWSWIEPAQSLGGQVTNAVLIGAGFLVLAALFVQYALILQIGSYIIWYVFMSVAYGQFTLLRIVLAFASIAIALRLLMVAVTQAGPSTPA